MSSGFIGANVLNEDPSGNSNSNLAAQVATNTADIATNTADIDTLDEQLQTLQGEILIPNGTSILVGNAPQPTKITGTSNSSLGMDSLNSLTLGRSNTAVVNNALYTVSTSSGNTAISVNSLLSCTGGSNSCLGYSSGSLITRGSGNICIGVGSTSGSFDNTVSDNTYIGNGTSTTASGVLGSLILGNNASCSTSDQLILSPSITTLNVLGLVSSTGSGEGTILEYDSSKNILPSAGTYNSVSKIDTAITAIQNSIPSSSSYILVNSQVSLQQALTAAQDSGLITEIFLPAGDYTVNSVATFSSSPGQNITINGSGRGTTRILASTLGGISITLRAGSTFTISNLSIVQNESSNGGIGLLVTSSSANNGPVNMENVQVGFNESVNGSFATNVQLYNISEGNFTDCWFECVGTTTTHFTLNGDSTFPAINNKSVNCFSGMERLAS